MAPAVAAPFIRSTIQMSGLPLERIQDAPADLTGVWSYGIAPLLSADTSAGIDGGCCIGLKRNGCRDRLRVR